MWCIFLFDKWQVLTRDVCVKEICWSKMLQNYAQVVPRYSCFCVNYLSLLVFFNWSLTLYLISFFLQVKIAYVWQYPLCKVSLYEIIFFLKARLDLVNLSDLVLNHGWFCPPGDTGQMSGDTLMITAEAVLLALVDGVRDVTEHPQSLRMDVVQNVNRSVVNKPLKKCYFSGFIRTEIIMARFITLNFID